MKVEIVYVDNTSRTLGNVVGFYAEPLEKDRDGNVVLGRSAEIEQLVVVDGSHTVSTTHNLVLDHEVLYLVVTDMGTVTVVPNTVRTFSVVPHAEQVRVANAKSKEKATIEHRKITKARHVKREEEKALRVGRKDEWLKNNLPTPTE